MRVSYPWTFKSKNHHFRLKLKNNVSLAERFNIKENSQFAVDTSELLLTFSDVVSTINEGSEITYHEFIVKCKVQFEDKTYYYPIMTFVDDAYSIIRGYYLGFEKCISGMFFEKDKISIDNRFVKFELALPSEDEMTDGDYQTYPFILIRNWRFDEERDVDQVVTLRAGGGTVYERKTFKMSDAVLGTLCDVLQIEADNVESTEAYYVNDEFILEGVDVLKDLKA